ncbi:MAG: T9SS type A sorting domain-containing protein [Chlorobi bacterium]|nr:T9SS type A sorting domain-containing protein [Chlorobiota bacterium]
MLKYFVFIILTILSFLPGSAQNDTCITGIQLGISFPPIEDATQRDFTKNCLNDLGVKKIRFAEEWKLREPEEGEFYWSPLDSRINWASENNYEIMLTIQSNGPDWACSSIQNDQSCVFNNELFKIYIDSLLKRYSGRISKIQFGNEWQSDYWYIGSAADFIEANNILYNSVKANSPSTKVVLGGFTTISLRFLAGCNGYVDSFYDGEGAFYDSDYLEANCSSDDFTDAKNRIDSVLKDACYDMLDIHLYDDVEQWDEYYQCFADTVTCPVIVSEFGGPNMNYEPYTDEYQSERLYQYVRKLDSLNIPEAYFFKLVEGSDNYAHSNSGLIYDTTYLEKPAYYLFKSFVSCLTDINENVCNNEIRFYPNPMKDFTIVEFQNFAQSGSMTMLIYKSDGRLVKKINLADENVFSLSRDGMASGIYLVVVKNHDSFMATGRLVVN